MRDAAREGDGAGGHLRHRQRVLRRWQRPRSHPPVVLVAVAGTDPGGGAPSCGGDGDAFRRAGLTGSERGGAGNAEGGGRKPPPSPTLGRLTPSTEFFRR